MIPAVVLSPRLFPRVPLDHPPRLEAIETRAAALGSYNQTADFTTFEATLWWQQQTEATLSKRRSTRFSQSEQKAKSRKSDKDESGEAETTRNKQLDTVQGVPTSFGWNTRKRNFISFRIFLNYFDFFQTVPTHNVETVRDNLKEYERYKTELKLHFCIECVKCNPWVLHVEGNLPISKLLITFKFLVLASLEPWNKTCWDTL